MDDEVKANWDWCVMQPDWPGERKAMEDALAFVAGGMDFADMAPRLTEFLKNAEGYSRELRIYGHFMIERERCGVSTAGADAMAAKATCEAAAALLEPRIKALRILLGFEARVEETK